MSPVASTRKPTMTDDKRVERNPGIMTGRPGIPGDPRPPEKVEDVTASAQPGGIIVADWPDTVRAAHYRVFKQVVGVDAELVLVKTVEESDVELTGVPSGATVKLQIVAANGLGTGTPSDVIELQAA